VHVYTASLWKQRFCDNKIQIPWPCIIWRTTHPCDWMHVSTHHNIEPLSFKFHSAGFWQGFYLVHYKKCTATAGTSLFDPLFWGPDLSTQNKSFQRTMKQPQLVVPIAQAIGCTQKKTTQKDDNLPSRNLTVLRRHTLP